MEKSKEKGKDPGNGEVGNSKMKLETTLFCNILMLSEVGCGGLN